MSADCIKLCIRQIKWYNYRLWEILIDIIIGLGQIAESDKCTEQLAAIAARSVKCRLNLQEASQFFAASVLREMEAENPEGLGAPVSTRNQGEGVGAKEDQVLKGTEVATGRKTMNNLMP